MAQVTTNCRSVRALVIILVSVIMSDHRAEDLTFEQMKIAVTPLVCRALPQPVSLQLPLGIYNPLILPITLLHIHDNPLVNMFDVISNHSRDIDFAQLEKAFVDANSISNFSQLPEPFGFKGELPKGTKMQIFIYPRRDGGHHIIKHFVCTLKCKPKIFNSGVYGQAYVYNWRSTDAKVGKKIIQYTLENLGGRQYKIFDLVSYTTPAKSAQSRFEDKDDEEIDKGFDFIQSDAPRSTTEMAHLRWMTKNLKNPASPIFQWPSGLVEKALGNLARDGALAKKEYDWPIPLTSTYYHSWLLDMLEEIWDFDQSALLLVGHAGVGKSPLGRSVLMAQARHNKVRFQARDAPCIRCTAEIDFLRGEPGSVVMGDFLDDTTLRSLSTKVLKYFLDVGLYESMVWARWGATKWVQNEPRACADNTWDEDALPDVFDFEPSIPFKPFWESIKGAFISDAEKSHRDAILKRTAILFNSKQHVYYRPAGINQNPIRRKNIPLAEYLTAAGKELFGKYKDGIRELPPTHPQEVAREQAWVTTIMNRRLEERKPDYHARQQVRRALFGETGSTSSASARAPLKVKKEQEWVHKKARMWSHELKSNANSVIDLDSPERSRNFDRIPVHESVVPLHPDVSVPNPAFEGPGDDMDVVSEEDADVMGHGFGIDSPAN